MSMDAAELGQAIASSLKEALKAVSAAEREDPRGEEGQPAFDFCEQRGGPESAWALRRSTEVLVEAIAQVVATEVVGHIQRRATATVTVDAGIPVTTAGSATAQSGQTTAPGTGSVVAGGVQ